MLFLSRGMLQSKGKGGRSSTSTSRNIMETARFGLIMVSKCPYTLKIELWVIIYTKTMSYDRVSYSSIGHQWFTVYLCSGKILNCQ